MPQRSEEQRIINAIKRTCLAGTFILIVLIIINLFIAMGIEKRSLPIGNMRMMFNVVMLLLAYGALNRYSYKISSFIILLGITLSFLVYPILPIDSRIIENIFLSIFLLCISTVLAFFLYNIKTEIKWILGWNFLIFILSTWGIAHNLGIIKDHELFEQVTKDPIIVLSYILLVVFINLILYNSRSYYYEKSAELSKTNKIIEKKLIEIDHQNSELISQKSELLSIQKEINLINDGLEEKVAKRTERLQMQNEALTKYGFLSSQLIRYPIRKLYSTMASGNEERIIQCEKELILEFNNTIADLENITIAIGDVLNNFDTDSIEHIEHSIRNKYSSFK